MDDLISRKALLAEYDRVHVGEPGKARKLMEDAPAVDAVEVVHAYWIKHEYAEEENGLLVPNYECSACRSWERDEGYYCPNCGAKMDGERKDNGYKRKAD